MAVGVNAEGEVQPNVVGEQQEAGSEIVEGREVVSDNVGRRDSSLQGLEILPEEEREEQDDDSSSDSSLDLEVEGETSQELEEHIESQQAQPKSILHFHCTRTLYISVTFSSCVTDKKDQQLPREVVLSTLVEVSLVRKVPELKFNPFADRICSTFSSRQV